MLVIDRLSKTYLSTRQDGAKPATPTALPTLAEVSLTAEKGEFISVIGPSGCGKSTLFNLVSGLEKPDSGRILLEAKDITGQRGHVSYMFQKDLLFPWRTVLDNCILGPELRNISREKARAVAGKMLAEFNLHDFAHYYPSQLSGGMRQRVALVRTMLAEKEVLLLDEPFGALDALTKREMHEWLSSLLAKYRTTVLFITHDVEEALFLSDRVYVLTERPARVKKMLTVDLPRPRKLELVLDDTFVEMKRELLDSLKYQKA